MTTQTIFRTSHAANYTVFGNALTQSNQLSPRAYRLLTYLLSLPDNWQVRVKHLMRHFGFGRDSTYKALRELRALGYAILKRGRRSSSWFIYDQPQTGNPDAIPHVEIVAEPTTEAASKITESKTTIFDHTLQSTYTSFTKEKNNNNTPDPLPDPIEPITPIVVVCIEEEQPIVNPPDPVPDTLPDPIIQEIEKLPLEPKQKKVAERTLSNLSLDECKMILAIYTAAIVKGGVNNKIGYLVGLVKASQNGTLSPILAPQQVPLAQRLAKEAKAREDDLARHKITNDQWAQSMINKLGLENFMKVAPWYVPQ